MKTATLVPPSCVKALGHGTSLLLPSGVGVYVPPLASRFGHMPSFDLWDISKRDANRGLNSLHSRACPVLPPGTLPCHANKSELASQRVGTCVRGTLQSSLPAQGSPRHGREDVPTTSPQPCQAKSGQPPAPHNFEWLWFCVVFWRAGEGGCYTVKVFHFLNSGFTHKLEGFCRIDHKQMTEEFLGVPLGT